MLVLVAESELLHSEENVTGYIILLPVARSYFLFYTLRTYSRYQCPCPMPMPTPTRTPMPMPSPSPTPGPTPTPTPKPTPHLCPIYISHYQLLYLQHIPSPPTPLPAPPISSDAQFVSAIRKLKIEDGGCGAGGRTVSCLLHTYCDNTTLCRF